MDFPEASYSSAGMATRSLGILPLTLAPPTARYQAHGRVGLYGTVSVQVSGACVVTLWCYSPASNTWVNPGSASSSYQKTFTGAGMDYFSVRPGTLFYITSDTGSITGYTDGDAIVA